MTASMTLVRITGSSARAAKVEWEPPTVVAAEGPKGAPSADVAAKGAAKKRARNACFMVVLDKEEIIENELVEGDTGPLVF